MIHGAVAAQDPAAEPAAPAAQTVRSPDGTIEVSIDVTGPLAYSIRIDGQSVIAPSKLGLKLQNGTQFGQKVELVKATHQSSDSTWQNSLGKRRVVRDQHNQLHLLLREQSAEGATFEIVFRVFNDGVAFRYELLSQPGMRSFVLEQELSEFAFPADFTCYAGEQEKGFAGPQEWEYSRRRLSDIKPASVIGLPLLVETPAAWVAIAEADLLDWAGMWIGGVDAAPNAASGAAEATATPITLISKACAASGWRRCGQGKHAASFAMAGADDRPAAGPADRKRNRPQSKYAQRNQGQLVGEARHDGLGPLVERRHRDGHRHDQAIHPARGRHGLAVSAHRLGLVRRIEQAGGRHHQGDRRARHGGSPPLCAGKGVRLWLWLHWTDVDRNDAYKKGVSAATRSGASPA